MSVATETTSISEDRWNARFTHGMTVASERWCIYTHCPQGGAELPGILLQLIDAVPYDLWQEWWAFRELKRNC